MSKEENRYVVPPTLAIIAREQNKDQNLKETVRRPTSGLSKIMVDDNEIIVKDSKRIVIPASLQKDLLHWYHHYLIHPGVNRMTNTLAAIFYWKGMHNQIVRYIRKCPQCQKGKKARKKYGKLPTKQVITVPWQVLCTDCIGPYTVKDKNKKEYQFMCVTMIDPATSWFEIKEIPVIKIIDPKSKKEKEVFKKTSARISKIINSSWL